MKKPTAFVAKAKKHIVAIAKAEKAGNKKAILKAHKALDSAIHGFVGKRPGEK